MICLRGMSNLSEFHENISWSSLGDDRVIGEHIRGFSIVKPIDDATDYIPLSCPVCHQLVRSQLDTFAFQDYECCNSCMLAWAQARKEQWLAGWRPSLKMMDEELHKRSQLPTYQVGSE